MCLGINKICLYEVAYFTYELFKYFIIIRRNNNEINERKYRFFNNNKIYLNGMFISRKEVLNIEYNRIFFQANQLKSQKAIVC